MAKFNEIQVGRFNRYLQKFLSMKGGPPSPTLGTDISPMLIIDDLGVDTLFLLGWDRFAFNTSFAASAANFNHIRLRNPAGSNVIAIIESITFTSQAGTDSPTVQLFVGSNADLGGTSQSQSLDTRQVRKSTCITSTSQGAQTFGTDVRDASVSGANISIELLPTIGKAGLALLPGNSIELENGIANQASKGGFWWRERALEDSELRQA